MPKIRLLLDTASNSNFLNKDVASGWELVENLAQSDGNYCDDFDRSIRGATDNEDGHIKELHALNAKIDKLVIALPRPIVERPIHYITDEEQQQIQEGQSYSYEEVSYIQNQGGYNKGYNNYKPPPSNNPYRNNTVIPPHPPVYPPYQHQPPPYVPFPNSFNLGSHPIPTPPIPTPPVPDFTALLQQIVQSQNSDVSVIEKHLVEINTNMDSSLVDLQRQIDTLISKINPDERRVASTSAPAHSSQLKGKSILDYTLVTEDSEVQEGEDLTPEKDQRVELDQDTLPANRAQVPVHEKPAAEEDKWKVFIPPPYKPKLPFPGRFKKQILEKYIAMFSRHINEIELKMPLVDAFMLIPDSHKFLKDMIMERIQEV